MEIVSKALKITIIITIIFACIFAWALNDVNDKIGTQEWKIEYAFQNYGSCYNCKVKTYINKDKVTLKIEKRDGVAEDTIRFLNDHGYQITLDEVLNDHEKGIEILKQYKKDNEIKKYGMLGVSQDISSRMVKEGYWTGDY